MLVCYGTCFFVEARGCKTALLTQDTVALSTTLSTRRYYLLFHCSYVASRTCRTHPAPKSLVGCGSEAFRGALILLETGGIDRDGFNGPYMDSERQKGFASYGNSHVMRILGKGERAMRSAWYQKWRVHLMQRPEALGGLVHNVLTGAIEANIDDSLINNKALLDRVFEANRKQNEANGKSGGTYLLSQVRPLPVPVPISSSRWNRR